MIGIRGIYGQLIAGRFLNNTGIIRLMKKRFAIFIALMMIMMVLPYASAGFFDFFKRITGKPVSELTNVSVVVGNSAPVIFDVQSISFVNLNEGTTKDIIFNFSARDGNGAGDLNDSSVNAVFERTGEPIRTGICAFISSISSDKTYICNVTMQYYDDNGAWNVNVSIKDIGGNYAENSSTFVNVNLLRAISISPTSIGFPIVSPGGTNIISSVDTSVNNNGNYEGTLDITAANLTGETSGSEHIPAGNFRASAASFGTTCTTGTQLTDRSTTTIASSNLPRGPSGNNEENVTYCLTLVPNGISTQTYSTNGVGSQAWVIATT